MKSKGVIEREYFWLLSFGDTLNKYSHGEISIVKAISSFAFDSKFFSVKPL